VTANWIFSSDFREFVEILALLSGYDLSVVEKEIMEDNRGATDSENGKWYSNEFKGKWRLDFSFAQDPGTSVIHFKFENNGGMDRELDTLFLVAQHYDLQNKNEMK
jgi:hypothetical protein